MSHWQLECILRPQEKMTHLLISQGDGSMGQDDAHWKQCRDWGSWSPYARGLAAPSCTKIPERSRWRLALTSPPGMRHLKKQSRETVKPCHSSLCSCGQGILKCVFVEMWRMLWAHWPVLFPSRQHHIPISPSGPLLFPSKQREVQELNLESNMSGAT